MYYKKIHFGSKEETLDVLRQLRIMAIRKGFVSERDLSELAHVPIGDYEDARGWSTTMLFEASARAHNLSSGKDIYYTAVLPDPVSKRVHDNMAMKTICPYKQPYDLSPYKDLVERLNKAYKYSFQYAAQLGIQNPTFDLYGEAAKAIDDLILDAMAYRVMAKEEDTNENE